MLGSHGNAEDERKATRKAKEAPLVHPSSTLFSLPSFQTAKFVRYLDLMGDFRFRIRFHLQGADRIDIAEETAVIVEGSGGNPSLILHSGIKGTLIKAQSRLVVRGMAYESREAALAAAQLVRDRLLAFAVRSRLGIDLGDDRLRGRFTPSGLADLEAQYNQPVMNDRHGVEVWESAVSTLFVDLPMINSALIGGERFLQSFRELLGGPSPFAGKEALAAELFTLSHFDTSFRSRFLTLMTALESLLSPAPRSKSMLDFIDETQKRLKEWPVNEKSPQEIDARNLLASGLHGLKKASIGQAGSTLAGDLLGSRTYMDKSAAEFFSFIYKIRSKIVHSGKASDANLDLLHVANVTSQFVADLLWELMDRRSGKPTAFERPTTIDAIEIAGPMAPEGRPTGPIVPIPYPKK